MSAGRPAVFFEGDGTPGEIREACGQHVKVHAVCLDDRGSLPLKVPV
jgi:hypothetical protein